MAITTVSGFDIQAQEPVDIRYVADTVTDLDNIPEGVRYEGMQCYVKEDKCIYALVDGVTNDNWKNIAFSNDVISKFGDKMSGGWLLITNDESVQYPNPSASDGNAVSYTVLDDGIITVYNKNGEYEYDYSKLEINGMGLNYRLDPDYVFKLYNANLIYGQSHTVENTNGSSVFGYHNIIMSTDDRISGFEHFMAGSENIIINSVDSNQNIVIGNGLKTRNSSEDNTYKHINILGTYNIPVLPDVTVDDGSVFIIGCGTSDDDRKNGIVLYSNGNLDILGDIKLFAGTEDEIPSLKEYISSALGANDAMVYKGTIGTGGTVTALPATHSVGWTYKVITAGTYAGQACEIGDMVICVTDGSIDDNSHWTVVQNNIDIMNGSTSSASGSSGLVPTPSSGSQNKYLKGDGTWSNIAQSHVTNLTTDLAAKAPLANPTFTGTVTLPVEDPSADTQAAHKKYVDSKNINVEKIIKIPISNTNFTTNNMIKKGTLISDIIIKINEAYSKNTSLQITDDSDNSICSIILDATTNMINHLYHETEQDSKLNINITDSDTGSGFIYLKIVEDIKNFE